MKTADLFARLGIDVPRAERQTKRITDALVSRGIADPEMYVIAATLAISAESSLRAQDALLADLLCDAMRSAREAALKAVATAHGAPGV